MKRPLLPNVLFYSVVIIILVLLGYLRDYLFVNINFQIYKLYSPSDYPYTLPPSLEFLDAFSQQQLYYGKYLLTAFFALAYFLVTFLTLKRLFRKQPVLKWTIIAYLCIFTFSVIAHFYGVLFRDRENGYTYSLMFMHTLQSPIMLMLLVPLFKLAQISKPQS